MPQWLTLVDSESSDNIAPLTTKLLRFEVDPLVAVGNYDVTIGLQGNNEILEPLRLVMKVSGKMPEWTVDRTKYEHQMNVIGQVRVGGILMENDESRVAAFIDGECRGIAAPEKVRGAAYVTMTIYGLGYDTADLNKPISFRIWDAATGVAYSDVNVMQSSGIPIDITFRPDTLIGNFVNPVIWTKGNKIEQNLQLNTLWNWISLGVKPESEHPADVFPILTLWQTIIKDKSTSIYSNGTEWRGSLMVKPATMYKVKLERAKLSPDLPEQLPVTGQQLDLSNTPVMLSPGWNWLAYTPLTTLTTDMALAAANPQRGDRVKSPTAIAIYNGSNWDGSLKALESGHGYMYYSVSDEEKQFVYPTTAQQTVGHRAQLLTTNSQLLTPNSPLSYPDNMTMVILLKDGEEVVDTCEVGAYIYDECRGATRATDGLYYLVIAGEGSGQPIEIRTCIDDNIMTIDRSLTYTTDRNIGTPWEPYVIDLKGLATGIRSFTDDADDSDWWTIEGFKIGRRPTRQGIYIHRGQKVTISKTHSPEL